MSDRRMQSSRDDRRRDRDGGDRRRRSRSPHHRQRQGDEVNSYESSRNYREREREQRYGGDRDNRDRRDWDRGSSRRDARRDDDDRRRDSRRGDLFDDRRQRRDNDYRREGRDDGGERERDRARDRDDMRQMERQTRQKSASPPRKPKEPTPDLTDVTSILQRKRRLTQWDIKPPGYENVTAEQAKLSGMFPLPGAPRAQPMDQSRLQAFMNQPQNQVSEHALKPSTSRQSKRVFVQNLPPSATDSSLADFFNLQLNGLNITKQNDPCVSATITEGSAMVEFKTPEDATNAMAFNGVEMVADSNGAGGLQIRRPKDYIVPAVADETSNGGVSGVVPDTQNKISITSIPLYLSEEQIQELLQSFGELRSFVLAKDNANGQSRGIAFCEYVDAGVTDAAVESLNDMELGDSKLKVTKASIGIHQVDGEVSVNAMSMMAGAKTENEGRVLCLMNMITPEELMDADEADEILEDVKEECSKFGEVLDMKMPRPTHGNRSNNGLGKIYVKYVDSASAQKALSALAGRKFADRTVVVTFFGEDNFDFNAW